MMIMMIMMIMMMMMMIIVMVIYQAKEFCEGKGDSLWNYDTCACEARSVVARGAGEEPGSR